MQLFYSWKAYLNIDTRRRPRAPWKLVVEVMHRLWLRETLASLIYLFSNITPNTREIHNATNRRTFVFRDVLIRDL